MAYSLAILWFERRRYLPAVLAVACSALLIATQFGVMLGIFGMVSMPIDRSRADVWVGHAGLPSVDISLPVPADWETRLWNQPGVERVEHYVRGVTFFGSGKVDAQICIVIGTRLDDESLGAIDALTPDLRAALAEPGTVVVDQAEAVALGVGGPGDSIEVNGCKTRVVGTVRGTKGLAGPYLFCSLATARRLLRLPNDQTTYLLARCSTPSHAEASVRQLRAYADVHQDPEMSAFTSADFSTRSRLHWVTKTKVGLALGFAAIVGLLVGGTVTGATLQSATIASLRQYAVLEALGISSWHLRSQVLFQSFWVGLAGTAVAVPATFGLAWAGARFGIRTLLPGQLLAAAAGLTLVAALCAGLFALRSLRQVRPTSLLR